METWKTQEYIRLGNSKRHGINKDIGFIKTWKLTRLGNSQDLEIHKTIFAFQQRNGTKSEIPRVKYQNLESEWQKSDKIERILWLGNKVRKSRDKVRKK